MASTIIIIGSDDIQVIQKLAKSVEFNATIITKMMRDILKLHKNDLRLECFIENMRQSM